MSLMAIIDSSFTDMNLMAIIDITDMSLMAIIDSSLH